MLIAVDIEATGLDPRYHQIIALGAVALDDRLQPRSTFEVHAHLFPGQPVDQQAAAINGYSLQEWQRRGAVEYTQLVPLLDQWLAATGALRVEWLAHNATFDRSFIDPLLAAHPLTVKASHRWRCSMSALSLYRDVAGTRGSCSLAALAKLCGHWTDADEADRHHGALADAQACAAGYAWIVDHLCACDHVAKGG